MAHSTPLVTALGGNDTILRKVAMVLFGSVLVSAAAQVTVPMFPVPMTLQTLAIMLIGLTYGARLAGATLVTYLAQGAMGFPVFAGGAFGLVPLMGPTAGFLFGFVAMAFVMGWLVERGLSRGFGLFAAALVATALLFVPGVLWLQAVPPLSLSGAFMAGAAPFLLGEVVKAAVAVLIVTGAMAALKNRLS
ncbi:MAG: biotin transporter BioY [Roseinatronobacter sp.]|nr:biotin transporter BioY [Roseinatronobacter sp.]